MFDRLPATRYFFRDDDANEDLPELRKLLAVFGRRSAPLSLAVIPGTLTQDCARLLLDQGPEVELHQHGWMHLNHEPTGRKCEFGPSRSFNMQRADIAAGRDRLRSLLAERCAPIFTPPWNRCTMDTCRALDELGFTTLSKDRSPRFAGSALIEISIAVDLFEWKPQRRLKEAWEIQKQIEAAARQSDGPLGLLLHHKVMTAEAFALVDSLLDAIPPAALHTMEGVCSLAT